MQEAAGVGLWCLWYWSIVSGKSEERSEQTARAKRRKSSRIGRQK
jgi:hypothetical protein